MCHKNFSHESCSQAWFPDIHLLENLYMYIFIANNECILIEQRPIFALLKCFSPLRIMFVKTNNEKFEYILQGKRLPANTGAKE